MTFNSQESSVSYDKLQDSNNNNTKLDEYITKLGKNGLTQNELNRIGNRYLEEKDKLGENTRNDLKNLLLSTLVTKIRSEIINDFGYKEKILGNFYKNSAEGIKFEDLSGNKVNFFQKTLVSREEVLILNKFGIEMQNIIDGIKNPSSINQTLVQTQEQNNKTPVQNNEPKQTPAQTSPTKEAKKTEGKQKADTSSEKSEQKGKKKIKIEKLTKKLENSEQRELIKGETGEVTGNNVRIRDKNGKYSGNEKVNKGDELILTGETIKLSKGIYYGVKMEDESIGYIHSKFIKLEKFPKIETKDDSKEQLENAKKSLLEATKTAKEMLKDDKKDLEKIKAVDKKIAEKIKEIDKLLAGSLTVEQISKSSEELEKLIQERKELLKKMETKGDKVEQKLDQTQSIIDKSGELNAKIEKGEKVVVADYVSSYRDDYNVDMDTPGRKYDKKTGTYYIESSYENNFELYKKDGKYILEMNGTGFFGDDKSDFVNMPTKEKLKSEIEKLVEKNRNKYQKEEITLTYKV